MLKKKAAQLVELSAFISIRILFIHGNKTRHSAQSCANIYIAIETKDKNTCGNSIMWRLWEVGVFGLLTGFMNMVKCHKLYIVPYAWNMRILCTSGYGFSGAVGTRWLCGGKLTIDPVWQRSDCYIFNGFISSIRGWKKSVSEVCVAISA